MVHEGTTLVCIKGDIEMNMEKQILTIGTVAEKKSWFMRHHLGDNRRGAWKVKNLSEICNSRNYYIS